MDVEFIVCRGLPASGKTTRARAWVAEDPTRRARVNRDDFRAMLHESVYRGDDTERQIKAARDATIRVLLRKGISVVNDDTNLPQRAARDLVKNALFADPSLTVTVWDMTDVPLATCVERDEAREHPVGAQVIHGMHERYLAGKGYPLPFPSEPTDPADELVPYVPPAGKPRAIMVDIDGTVALHGARSPFDETRVSEDRPNERVIEAVRVFHHAGYEVIFCSGRTDGCREATASWLAEHVGVEYRSLFMRAAGDVRKDAIVKREIFDREIRDSYRVVAVLDDRNQVVDAWRALGLTVFQVAPGDF